MLFVVAGTHMPMPFVYNLHRQKNIRRRLRNNTTLTERRLWLYLRGRQLDDLKFRRQYGIRQYIVDFCCPEIKLAIEIDGEPHRQFSHQYRHDMIRQRRLEALGIHVLRFSSNDVLENTQTVLGTISQTAAQLRLNRSMKTPMPS